MADKIHRTKAIILKQVKYGETSIIATAYTELFGLQSYLINGIRTASKKAAGSISFFQPAAILDMEVYHNEFRQLNRIKEYRWAPLYKNIFTDILKNGVATFMIELLTKCLKQPERNADLFAFAEDCLTGLDDCNDQVMANYPVFFAVHLTGFFGFLPETASGCVLQSNSLVFDIQAGTFTEAPVFHSFFLDKKCAVVLATLLQVRHPDELDQIETNVDTRRKILEAMEYYYSMHIHDFGKMRTLQVLQEIMR
ncbi:MAG: DNA repair protein RecO [Niabella sp.]